MDIVSINWNAIRDDYLSSDISYRQLCTKHNVKYGKLSKIAQKEGWASQKKELKQKEISREERILNISDSLLDKIEKSIADLGPFAVITFSLT